MKYTKLYNGVRLLGDGPSLKNIEKIDSAVWPMTQFFCKVGMQVDLDHFAQMEKDLDDDLERITEDVRDMTGYRINLSSGDQVSDLLFKKLGLKQARIKFTPTGDRESVEEEVLVAIQHDHEVVPKILEYKELDKLRGTYVSPMKKLAKYDEIGKRRLFPNLTHTRVPAGRYACKEPNLLAMPSRTDRGRQIRCGFICDPGYVYLTVDVSQIHVRIGAHLSGDPNLIRVYENGEDIYSDFATTAFRLKDERYKGEAGKWKYPTVHKEDHRFPSKTCILASIYDVTAMGLLEQMPVICANCNLPATKHTCAKFVSLWTEAKCQELITAFYIKYPGILKQRLIDHGRARKFGYLWDMWGRIIHTTAVRSVHPWVVATALRECANFPYLAGEQGIMKLAMAELWDTLVEAGLTDMRDPWNSPVQPVLPIHDEVLFVCREDLAEEVGELTKHIMENCVPLKVPIVAEYAQAINWGSIAK